MCESCLEGICFCFVAPTPNPPSHALRHRYSHSRHGSASTRTHHPSHRSSNRTGTREVIAIQPTSGRDQHRAAEQAIGGGIQAPSMVHTIRRSVNTHEPSGRPSRPRTDEDAASVAEEDGPRVKRRDAGHRSREEAGASSQATMQREPSNRHGRSSREAGSSRSARHHHGRERREASSSAQPSQMGHRRSHHQHRNKGQAGGFQPTPISKEASHQEGEEKSETPRPVRLQREHRSSHHNGPVTGNATQQAATQQQQQQEPPQSHPMEREWSLNDGSVGPNRLIGEVGARLLSMNMLSGLPIPRRSQDSSISDRGSIHDFLRRNSLEIHPVMREDRDQYAHEEEGNNDENDDNSPIAQEGHETMTMHAPQPRRDINPTAPSFRVGATVLPDPIEATPRAAMRAAWGIVQRTGLGSGESDAVIPGPNDLPRDHSFDRVAAARIENAPNSRLSSDERLTRAASLAVDHGRRLSAREEELRSSAPSPSPARAPTSPAEQKDVAPHASIATSPTGEENKDEVGENKDAEGAVKPMSKSARKNANKKNKKAAAQEGQFSSSNAEPSSAAMPQSLSGPQPQSPSKQTKGNAFAATGAGAGQSNKAKDPKAQGQMGESPSAVQAPGKGKGKGKGKQGQEGEASQTGESSSSAAGQQQPSASQSRPAQSSSQGPRSPQRQPPPPRQQHERQGSTSSDRGRTPQRESQSPSPANGQSYSSSSATSMQRNEQGNGQVNRQAKARPPPPPPQSTDILPTLLSISFADYSAPATRTEYSGRNGGGSGFNSKDAWSAGLRNDNDGDD